MKFKENLLWILDKNDRKNDDTKYQENIDFVHSLGKKCDCVGWSKLDLDEPDADEVLNQIETFCKENGWRARGLYERTYTDIRSDWYELKTESFKDNTVLDIVPLKTETDKEILTIVISAYHELSASPKEWQQICVPERFRKACQKNNITDVDFCWVQDKGKYEAEQYFYIFPQKSIPRIIYDKKLNKKRTDKIKELGGYLPKIASVFHQLQHIGLQDCYLKEDMPAGGIAYVYCPSAYDFSGRRKILIHKDTAETLIKEKALSWANLTPACVVDECPKGYLLDETEVAPTPTKEYFENSFKEYEKLKAKNRPQYVVKEKEALKLLRKNKSERKADYNKRLSKNNIEKISDSIYRFILPYYMVSDGCVLSDEYELLSYGDSLRITEEFFENLEKEELLITKPNGIIISTCADGDYVLVTENEKVLRFSHEEPEIISEWKSVAEFIVEALNNS